MTSTQIMVLVIAVSILIYWCCFSYCLHKEKHKKFDLNKYIIDNFETHQARVLIVGGGGKFKQEDDWLVYYNCFDKERCRTYLSVDSENADFKFLLKDALDKINFSLITDWSAM